MNWKSFFDPFNMDNEPPFFGGSRMSHHNCYNKQETDDMVMCMGPLLRREQTQDIIELLPADGNAMIKVSDLRKQLSDIRGTYEDEARKYRSFNTLWAMFQKGRR